MRISDLEVPAMSELWFKFHFHWIEDSPVFANAEYFKLFVWLLARARRNPGSVALESGEVVSLDTGECIVGRIKGAKALGIHPSTFRNRLDKLEEFGAIKLDSKDNAYTRVSIVFPFESNHKKDKPRTGLGQAEDRLRTGLGQVEDTNKRDKRNERNRENALYPPEGKSSGTSLEKQPPEQIHNTIPGKPKMVRFSKETVGEFQIPEKLNTPAIRQALSDFETMRLRKGKRIQDRGNVCRGWDRSFVDADHCLACIDFAISNEYQGIKPDYVTPSNAIAMKNHQARKRNYEQV